MWQALIGPVVNLVGGHFERKVEEKRAVHERKMEAIAGCKLGKYPCKQCG